MNTVFVVMIGEFPTAAAPTLELAQSLALTDETRRQTPGEWEHRWDARTDGEQRLMQRRTARGSRFSWTHRSVRPVDYITEENAR